MPRQKQNKKKILFAVSEIHPLIKTGGLADVAGALPPALKSIGAEIRVILPAYRTLVERLKRTDVICPSLGRGLSKVRLLKGRLPDEEIELWLVDAPALFDRPGTPYGDEQGVAWPDNGHRFGLFARAVEAVALDQAGLNWTPDLVHCNDWQAGLVPALLSLHHPRPATLFTIHNLAYQGCFPPKLFHTLGLPGQLWGMDGLEFYGELAFIKGGLVYADMINTVSPTYAREICTEEFGHGLEGLLKHRSDRLSGILNGVDYRQWDPATDTRLNHHYDPDHLEGKALNKQALQKAFGLPPQPTVPLFGLVGRLAEQKGVDLVLKIVPQLARAGAQLVILGTGEKQLETALSAEARRHPDHLAVKIGFSEPDAHLIEAGADLFLMPSRYEPCGLNQLYSLKYGTVPIVRRTGGLADTVTETEPQTLKNGQATGFLFEKADHHSLWPACKKAIELYHRHPETWRQLMTTGMKQDYSWQQSARSYLSLYDQAISHKNNELASTLDAISHKKSGI